MRICVVGAGAIGGFFAARLGKAGHDVSVLARGATLFAIDNRGLTLQSDGQTIHTRPRATDNAEVLGEQDVVIFAVKSPALPQAAQQARPLIGTNTIVIPALNGVPWWFFLLESVPLSGVRLKAVDPEGQLEAALPIDQIVGCVVFPSCSTLEPGVVRHASGNRVAFGEPLGLPSERTKMIADTMSDAGFDATAVGDIRNEIWLKLLGNLCFNPVSMLAERATDELIDDPNINALFESMMYEAIDLGRRIGIDLTIEPKQRIALTRRLGHVKTSMLQDLEARKPVELEAILGTIVSIAAELKHPAPLLHAVYAIAKARASGLGLLHANR
uniref:2-dehydropantoate 2-reductase n=1 Tax=Burkholderia sp. (strain CCGE1003) TaxID=640512 RepID=E1TIN7_BURSG